MGGGNFFCRFFLAIILLCRIFLGAGYFFPVSFAIQDFLFCRIFPFYLFFCHPPPLQMHAKLLVKVNGPFPWGKGGVLPLNRAEGSELFFTPPVFFWVKRSVMFFLRS